ncbi:MAG: alpha/beta hydrolase, partial [Anaerolineae bacterium]|nr:alpha/beta hydrolase [Anaerolineae bacterium]
CGDSTRPIDRLDSKNTYQNMTQLENSLGLGTQIADIERIRRILGEEKLVLVGHSFGGFLAALYAAEFPNQVEALVLVAPANMLVMPQAEGSDLFSLVRERLPADEQEAFDAFMDSYLDFNLLFENSETDLVQKNRDLAVYFSQAYDLPYGELEAEPGGWMVWGMYTSMGQEHDYRDALANISAPTLVLHGANDLQSASVSEEYARLIPHSEFQVIEGAAHIIYDEQPQAFAQVVRTFLEKQ